MASTRSSCLLAPSSSTLISCTLRTSTPACCQCAVPLPPRIRRRIYRGDEGGRRSRSFYSSSLYRQIDHYATLGIGRGASSQEIKLKFYKLSKEHHPDLNPQDPNSAELFKQFAHAYSILSDPVSRANHDATLSSRLPTHTYDAQYDPYASPISRTNAARSAQAHYAWRTRVHQRTPSSSRPMPSQPNLSQTERHEFEATMARFARLANRRAQTQNQASQPPIMPSSIFSSNTVRSDDGNSSRSQRMETKPQAVQNAVRLAVLLTMMCWLGTKFSPT